MTQLLQRRTERGPVEIDNRERFIRLAYFLAIVLVLAIFTGFSPFLGVIFALVLIVMLHEFGHFVTAKWAGMKVSEYFFGFGPRLWSIRKGETEYGIKAIPVGGYVRILGMNNLEQVDPADQAIIGHFVDDQAYFYAKLRGGFDGGRCTPRLTRISPSATHPTA